MNKELPFLGAIDEEDTFEEAVVPKLPQGEEIIIAEPSYMFDENELKYLQKIELPEPNKLLEIEKENLILLENNVTKTRNEYSYKIGGFKKIKRSNSKRRHKKNEKRRNALNKYLETINLIKKIQTTKNEMLTKLKT